MLQNRQYRLIVAVAVVTLLAAPRAHARQAASGDGHSAELAPIAWIASTWVGHQGPAAPQGSDVEMFVRWTPNGRALLMDLTIISGAARQPFMSATYYWNPATRGITMWQIVSSGAVNDGRVVSASASELQQELHITELDGRARDTRTRFVRDGADAFQFISSSRQSPTDPWTEAAPIRFVRHASGSLPISVLLGLNSFQSQPRDMRAETTVCAQSFTPRVRAFRVDDGFTVSGAGSRQDGAGTIWVWTGESCAAWVRATGAVDVDASWQKLSFPPGAAFEAFQDDAAGTRTFKVSGGAREVRLNGSVVLPTAADEAWFNGMVREFVRRSGVHAVERASSILHASGVAGIAAEAGEISGAGTRARYLASAIPAVAPGARGAFLIDAGRLLDHGSAWSQFLSAVPQEWSREDGVLAAVYSVTAGVEPDAIVESVLRRFAPPQPLAADLRPLVERMVDSLQSVERRTALRESLLGLRSGRGSSRRR